MCTDVGIFCPCRGPPLAALTPLDCWIPRGQKSGKKYAHTNGQITLLLSSAFQVVSVEHGYGHHVTALTAEQKQATTFYYMIASTFLITASAWSKTSFAITLLRITDSKTKKFIWFLIISMNASKMVSAMLQWISCQPLQKSWNPLYQGGSCWDKMPIAYYNIFSGGKFFSFTSLGF